MEAVDDDGLYGPKILCSNFVDVPWSTLQQCRDKKTGPNVTCHGLLLQKHGSGAHLVDTGQ